MAPLAKRQLRRAYSIRFGLRVVAVLLLLFVAVFAVRAAWRMYERFTGAAAAREAAEGSLAALESQEEILRAQLSALSTDRGVEAAVRERFGVVRPGEEVIHIVRTGRATSTEPSSPSLWIRLRTLFSL